MTRNLQEHILQTASQLFYSQGIKTTGVDAIVKAAGKVTEWLVVELDDCATDMTQAVRDSYTYLKKARMGA